MPEELWILMVTAATVGFVHTISGPDHYLPFLVIGRARGWKMGRTLSLTVVCGIAHIASSVVLGTVGIAAGIAVSRLEAIESLRGDWAAWALVLFGASYTIWGLWKALSRHSHAHFSGPQNRALTPWVLFLIFVLGPCEPLIPLLMVPAAHVNWMGIVLVTVVFGVVTLLTMLGAVLAATYSFSQISLGKLERFSHALAGMAILLCGVGMVALGL